jgi:curli biogenesis system outer membrane secretion channel CsgG
MRRLAVVVAVLVLGSVVAAQKLPTKGTDMEMAQNVSIPELTEAISARLVAQWEGWKN